MDPSACLKALAVAIKDGDRAAQIDCAEAMLGWLDAGGYLPNGMEGSPAHRRLIRGHCVRVLREDVAVVNGE